MNMMGTEDTIPMGESELGKLDAVLSRALRASVPGHLVQRIYDQTVGYLAFHAPDAELTEIDNLLRRELQLGQEVPADLSRKVYDATVTSLPHYLDEELTELDSTLARSMRVDTPAGLTARIVAATTTEAVVGDPAHDQVADRDPVIARIGVTAMIRRVSMAAAVIVGVSAGWWLYQFVGIPHVEQPDPSVLAIEREVDRFADSLHGVPTTLDTQIITLAAEIDEAEVLVQSTSISDPLYGTPDQIADELSLLESELGSF